VGLRVISLMRNFGQTPAIFAGFAHARGGVVAMIDADLQDPPEELPKLFAKLDEGYDVVQGWRENRQDSLFRTATSRALNKLVSRLLGTTVHDLGCGMKVYRRAITDRMCTSTHHNRYMPAEIMWLGVKIAEVKTRHISRARGKSKYNVFKLMHLNFDMLASISTLPIKLMEAVGWLFSMIGGLIGVAIFVYWVCKSAYSPFALIVMCFFLLAGIQMVATGIMCEYVSRIYVEVQNRPYYVVKEVIE
jgi:undecaprenyl-phosphate 4-deoxy-4-formamido-L-arabinose transferase